MKRFLIISLLAFSSLFCYGDDLTEEQKKLVTDFINVVKQGKKAKLAGIISFPLNRDYPIPPIKNELEFLSRYKEVFDDVLVKMIVNSKLSEDWSAMGWRGIMLLSGEVWLDYDGKLIAVNYQSEAEKKMKAALIKQEKDSLHESLKVFETPVCVLETAKFRIRIDDMGDGKYRYASWSLHNKMSDKPDMIIENGKIVFEGSGDNHHYEFKKGVYLYQCDITVIGEEGSPPAYLTIYKGKKEVVSQPAVIVEK